MSYINDLQGDLENANDRISQLETQLAEAQAEAAAMRDLTKKALTDITVHRFATAERCLQKALAPDAGKELLKRLERAEREGAEARDLAAIESGAADEAEHERLKARDRALEEAAQHLIDEDMDHAEVYAEEIRKLKEGGG